MHVLDNGVCVTCEPRSSRRGRRSRVLMRKFNPAEPRDPHGRWTKTGAAVGKVLDALKDVLGSADDDGSLLLGDDGENGYLDWSTYRNGVWSLEIGDAQNDTVGMDLTEPDMRQVASALSVTLLREHAPAHDPNDRHSTLLHSLLHAHDDEGAVLADDEGVEQEDRYLDWSTRDGDRFRMEVGADGDAVSVDMTLAELEQLHAKLTRTLLKPEGQQRSGPVSAKRSTQNQSRNRNPNHDHIWLTTARGW